MGNQPFLLDRIQHRNRRCAGGSVSSVVTAARSILPVNALPLTINVIDRDAPDK